MNVNNRQQLLLIVAGCGLALLVSDRLILTPLTSSFKDRSDQIVKLKDNINNGNQIIALERSTTDRWRTMRTNTLPEDLSAAENLVFKAFDKWSLDSGISVSSIKPEWKHPSDEYVALEGRVDAFGSLQSITKFIYEIENVKRQIGSANNTQKEAVALRIESVELSARDNNGSQLSLGLLVSGLQLGEQKL